jgi:hypothetical protein
MIKILLIAGAAAASLPQQFDLSCMTSKPNRHSVPFAIKIDLERGEWCIGKCKDVFKIGSVTSSTIILGESDDRDGRAGQRIDRVTGEYYFYEESPKAGLLGFWSQRGKCAPGPFTGFGDEARKF